MFTFLWIIENITWCICRASLGWFAHEPEWYDTNYTNFAQCEAQSVSLFVHYLSNVKGDAVQLGPKGNGQENGNTSADVVIILCLALAFACTVGFGTLFTHFKF